MPDEVLACGHVYVLNETMVHRMPSCMKCADCCTCVSIRKSFKDAADAMQKAMDDMQVNLRQLGKKLQKEQESKMTKADWQRREGGR